MDVSDQCWWILTVPWHFLPYFPMAQAGPLLKVAEKNLNWIKGPSQRERGGKGKWLGVSDRQACWPLFFWLITFHMPKPPQSTTPHHFSHALNTQKTVQDLTWLPILQRQTTHPSHHQMLCSPQALQILSLSFPCLSPICQHTVNSGPENLSLHVTGCTTGCQDGR